MAEKFVIKAVKRETRGKNEARRLRVEGKVPVVVYGGGSESLAATAALSDLAAVLRTDTGVNTVFSLDIDGEGVNDVIFQDRQIDPVRGRLIHADLRRFAKGEKIEMTVPIHLLGNAIGLKEEGAVLTQAMREIKVVCEPTNTPDSIDVDVTDLEVGQAIHVSDLKIGEGIEISLAPETVVASIVVVQEVVLEPQIEEGAAPEVVGEESPAPEEGGGEGELVGPQVTNWLIVGLGNPGPDYAKTRHNLGFMLVDALAGQFGTTVKRSECRSLMGRADFDNQLIELAKPQTYMNLSGEAVGCLVAKDERSVERLIVISDDLALPFGTIRIRPKGTHGGQNGLRSIIDVLKTQDFTRLRIGIQPEHPIADASRFVLENFPRGDLKTVEETLAEAVEAIKTIIREGVDEAVARFN